MAYFKELPFIEYPSVFEDKYLNDEFILARNLFRRAILREDIANSATAFNYYQIQENERPDQIAERIYGDSELDWVILITNNIINYPSQWVLSNDSFYDYLINKYGSEDKLNEVKYIETNEVKDEFDRLIIPKELQVQTDLKQKFKTIENKENPLFYDLDFFPVPSKHYPLEIKIDLGQYAEVWERGNLENDQEYTGQEYKANDTYVRAQIDPSYGLSYPSYSRLDFTYFPIYMRNDESFNALALNDLNGWPYSWGGNLLIYDRNDNSQENKMSPTLGTPVDITDDYRLYTISYLDEVSGFSYTDGTTISSEANSVYKVINPKSNLDGIESIFEIKRNSKGEIISVKVLDGGRKYTTEEIITIKGSTIGGIDNVDDMFITVNIINQKPQFKFFTIGNSLNLPYPNLTVTTFNETGISYLNSSYSKVDIYNNENIITHYEYEDKINEENRKILLLKPEYLGVFIGNLRNIMSYSTSSETITNKIKRVQAPL